MTAAPRTGPQQEASSSHPSSSEDLEERRADVTFPKSKFPTSRRKVTGKMYYRPPPPHTPLSDLLANLAKHWQLSGPTCLQLHPGNAQPSSGRHPLVSSLGHHPSAGGRLQVQVAPASRREGKQRRTVQRFFYSQMFFYYPISSCLPIPP